MVTNENPEIEEFLYAIGLETLDGVESDYTERVASFGGMVDESFRTRRFVIGLAMAFLALAEETLTIVDRDSVEDIFAEFTYEEVNPRGAPVNTLNLQVGDDVIQI